MRRGGYARQSKEATIAKLIQLVCPEKTEAFDGEKYDRDMEKVRSVLLGHGGTRVVGAGINWFADKLLGQGHLFPTTGLQTDVGAPSSCHENAAHLYFNPRYRYSTIVNGYGLSDDGIWRHHSWRALVQVEDSSRREDLLEKTFAEGWTCTELADAVRGDGDHNSNAGRPLKVPASFDGMVQQQLQAAEKWEKRSQKVWDHPEKSLLVKAAELSFEDVTEERLKEAAELAHRLRGLAVEANKAADKAEAVVRDFERILADRKSAQERKDDEPKTKNGHERKAKAGKRKVAATAK